MSLISTPLKPSTSQVRPSTPPSGPLPFVLTSPEETLATRGCRHVLSQPVTGGLLAAASRLFAQEGRDAMLVGALPFDRGADARLVLPEETRRHDAPFVTSATVAPAGPSSWRVAERPARDHYEAAVRRALDRIRGPVSADAPAITKVVLARLLEVEAPQAIDPLHVLDRLRADPGISAFCVPLTPSVDGISRTLVGASPELLIEKRGARVTSLPMAGSAARQLDDRADRDVAHTLARSGKDQREHRLVVESVLDVLAPHCRQLRAADAPELAATATMWHLATPIDGELKREVSSLELAAALHPTPAVCGTPRDEAQTFIAQLEPFDRGFFAGTVGWCDGRGDGRWMVTIRCAEIAGATARIFAGAGIVDGSDPAAEAAETSAKFRTLLHAFGIDDRGRPRRPEVRS